MRPVTGLRTLLPLVYLAAACGDQTTVAGPSQPEAAPPPSVSTTTASYDCSAQTDIPQVECDALVTLYNATDGPNWTDQLQWFVGSPCNWAPEQLPDPWNHLGVGCQGGHVGTIYLFNNNLTGSTPPELGDLPGLRQLHLQNNGLSGSIPSELGNLTGLDELKLHENNLSGSIPPELGNLTSLGGLWLTGNSLSGPIPPELGNLSNLKFLHLHQNNLSGSIPPELGNLSSLITLDVNQNNLSGSIPPELGNLSNLKQLWLLDNNLTGMIPPQLGNPTGLEYLMLWNNSLSGPIPPELGNLTSLTHIWLHNNSLSGLVPLGVATVGTNALECFFSPNPGLYVPDTPEYRALGSDICGLPFSAFVPVAIDIKPGSDPNSVNCTIPHGIIPVAILTTADFDATTVDHATVTFDGATEMHATPQGVQRHEKDVDDDGDIDLVFHFQLGETTLDCGSTEGTLTGETFDGIPIEGTDAVNMIDPGQP